MYAAMSGSTARRERPGARGSAVRVACPAIRISDLSKTQRGTILALFFGSGACALVYETVWVRQLTLSFGISIYAISAVLAAYMFGLSIGAWIVGRFADRIQSPLTVYAVFELAISAYAIFAHWVLEDRLPLISQAGHELLAEVPIALNVSRFALAFALLVVPTTLMGGTLPLLGRFLAERAGNAGVQLGRLYGLNTLGAVLGTGIAGFWALKHLGVLQTTQAAVAANVAIALLALWLARAYRAPAPASAAPVTEPTPRPARPTEQRVPGHRLVLLVLFLSGFAALSYEVMWNRTMLLYVHNSTYAFSMILMIFLLGVGLGGLAYARLPAAWTSFKVLGIAQLALGGYVWLSIPLTGLLPSVTRGVVSVVGMESWFSALATMVAVCTLVVLPPALLMGLSFPMGTALCTRSTDEVGVRIGAFYALNTLGNILGSVITGFVLIGTIGLRNTFAVAIAANLIGGALLLSFRPYAPRRLVVGAASAALLIAAFLTSIDRDVFRGFYEDKYRNLVFYHEDVADTVMVVERENGDRLIRYSDGRGTAGTASNRLNRMYGHLPMVLHEDPRSVLSICFGVGNTLSAISYHEPERLVCVELSRGVLDAGEYFPTNDDVLATPGLEMVIEDGRYFLLTTEEQFDVIQLEPPEIHTAAVVNLYTREFYELARDRLPPDGILCQWFNVMKMPEHEMKMLFRTFIDVFPHASLWAGDGWWDFLLIGSPTPIVRTPEELGRRFNQPRVRTDLIRCGYTSVPTLLSRHVLGPQGLAAYVGDVPVITDDWTYVDFSVPQSAESGYGLFGDQTAGSNPRLSSARIRQRDRMILDADSPLHLLESPSEGFLARLEAEIERYRDIVRDRLEFHRDRKWLSRDEP